MENMHSRLIKINCRSEPKSIMWCRLTKTPETSSVVLHVRSLFCRSLITMLRILHTVLLKVPFCLLTFKGRFYSGEATDYKKIEHPPLASEGNRARAMFILHPSLLYPRFDKRNSVGRTLYGEQRIFPLRGQQDLSTLSLYHQRRASRGSNEHLLEPPLPAEEMKKCPCAWVKEMEKLLCCRDLIWNLLVIAANSSGFEICLHKGPHLRLLIVKVTEAGQGKLLQDSFSSKPRDGSAGMSPQTWATRAQPWSSSDDGWKKLVGACPPSFIPTSLFFFFFLSAITWLKKYLQLISPA